MDLGNEDDGGRRAEGDHPGAGWTPATPEPPSGGDEPAAPPGGAGGPAPVARRLRLASLIEVIACSGLPTQLAIAGLLAVAGIRPFDHGGRLSTAYVFTLSVADAAAMVGLVLFFLHLHGERPRHVLLGARRLLPEGLLGLVQIPVVFGLVIAVMGLLRHFAPWMHNVPANPMEGLVRTRLDAWLFVVVAIVGGGVREEVQRAFILHRFDQHLGGGWLGLLLFSLLFGAGHVIQGRDVAVTTAVLGVFWGAVYLRRRSIASTVVSHSGFNAAEILRFVAMGR